MAFNDQVLQPFLRNNAAVNNWLDPHLFVIPPAGPPTPAVAAAIASIRVASSALPATSKLLTALLLFCYCSIFLRCMHVQIKSLPGLRSLPLTAAFSPHRSYLMLPMPLKQLRLDICCVMDLPVYLGRL